VDLEHF
jgi:serine/threonine-protein kinase OSR1/STK39